MRRVLCVFVLSLYACSAVIYHLNETEYARMPPLYALDEFGRCLVPSDGTYCMLRVDLFSHDNGTLINMIHEYSKSSLKHYNHTYLHRGVCVTSTCKDHIKNNTLYITEGLEQILEGCLNESIYTEYGLQAKLTQLYYCEKTGQQIEKDVWDWIVMGIFIAIAMVNGIGTLYDAIISRSNTAVKGNPYILSFSLIQNWNRLVSAEPENIRTMRLTGLHGIRVLTLFLMFIAHVIFVNSMGFNDNIRDFEEFYDNPYYQIIFNGMVVIQIFFVISGFLLVYNMEIYCEKHDLSWGLALKIWIMRFMRLTPSYAMMMAFMTTWLRHLGSGPLWRLFVADTVVANCRGYWWAHLTYINNYIGEGNFCAVHTWHLAADTQLFCIGLLAYFATKRGGRNFLLGVLITLGIVLPAVHVWMWDLDPLVLMTPETYRTMVNDTFYYLHVYGHTNLVSYAIGMATGCLVYHLQKKGVNLADNKLCQFLVWMMVPIIVALLYSGSIFYIDGWQSPLALRMVYAALQRFIVGVVAAFGMVALALRLNSYVRGFFEWNVWLIPSRLSYTVYLLHLAFINAYLGLRHQLGHASTFNMTLLHFGVMLFTFMVALPFSLMVEAPITKLLKISPAKEEQTKC